MDQTSVSTPSCLTTPENAVSSTLFALNSPGHNAKECTIKSRSEIKFANCGANDTVNFDGCPKNTKNLKNCRVTAIRPSN